MTLCSFTTFFIFKITTGLPEPVVSRKVNRSVRASETPSKGGSATMLWAPSGRITWLVGGGQHGARAVRVTSLGSPSREIQFTRKKNQWRGCADVILSLSRSLTQLSQFCIQHVDLILQSKNPAKATAYLVHCHRHSSERTEISATNVAVWLKMSHGIAQPSTHQTPLTATNQHRHRRRVCNTIFSLRLTRVVEKIKPSPHLDCEILHPHGRERWSERHLEGEVRPGVAQARLAPPQQ